MITGDNKPIEEQPTQALREAVTILRTLKQHPGWTLVASHAAFQQGNYQRTALKPIQSMDNVPFGEFTKGVAQGITEVLELPDQLLEEIETELAARASHQPQTAQGEDDGSGSDDDC